MAKMPKKPKAPKVSASIKTWENYQKKIAEWKRKCAPIVAAKKRKESIIASTRKA